MRVKGVKMNKKLSYLLTIIAVIICIITGSVVLVKTAYEKFTYIIVLDAGHGGIDGGVTGVSTGVKESELNLKTVYILKQVFEKAGYKVVLTRKDDDGLYGNTGAGFKLRDLKKRKEIINSANAELVISIHMNKYQSSSRRGAQVFFKQNDIKSKCLADKIQLRLNNMSESVRISNALKGDYYILNTSKIPAVIVECGFLSNVEDEKLLTNDSYLNKLALEIFNGAIDYINLSTDAL